MLFVQCKSKKSKLRLKEVLVFSMILRRFNIGKGTSRRHIARQTGIDRVKTLPGILSRLIEYGLVVENRRTRTLFPHPPGPEVAGWFAWKARDCPWYKKFSHFKVLLRSDGSPLSQEQNVIYWKLRDLERQRRRYQTHLGLGMLLGVSRVTIKNAFDRLRSLGLVEFVVKGRRLEFTTKYPNEAEGWFRTADKKTQTGGKPEMAKETENESQNSFVRQLMAAGLDQKRAMQLDEWSSDVDLMPSWDGIEQLKRSAMSEHAKNGRTDTDKWGPLFYWKVQKIVERRLPIVEAERRSRERDEAREAALLRSVREAGYFVTTDAKMCCDEGRMEETLTTREVYGSDQKGCLLRTLKGWNVSESTGTLKCSKCGKKVPDVGRWFVATGGIRRYFILPSSQASALATPGQSVVLHPVCA